MKDRLINIISDKRVLIILFALFAIAASIQSLSSGSTTIVDGKIKYNKYNNYTIFAKSFTHLQNNQDLYIAYPDESWDLFKYTPTFAVFFGVFAAFPDWIGLPLWNLLNALLLLFAIYYLPQFNKTEKGTILLIILIELMTSMQNGQSNALITGLLVFSFGLLEKKQYLLATLLIVFSIFIKLFGIVGLVLLIYYPKKWKLALYSALWFVVLAAIPLIFIDIAEYTMQLQSFWHMLTFDHSTSYGLSVMGWLKSWFEISFNKNVIVLIGAVIFMIPLIRIKQYKNYLFRLLTLASVLIWVVIFNHKAESPTFILAMTGVAIWFTASKKSTINIILFSIAFTLTTLSPTDIFPTSIRHEFINPYTLKAFPCILIWFAIVIDMITQKNNVDDNRAILC